MSKTASNEKNGSNRPPSAGFFAADTYDRDIDIRVKKYPDGLTDMTISATFGEITVSLDDEARKELAEELLNPPQEDDA